MQDRRMRARMVSILFTWILVCAVFVGIVNEAQASVFSMDSELKDSHASFWGEDAGDYSGNSVASAGDVNGDGYDDILIGTSNDEDGGSQAGQTYLILGNASGWAMDTDLSNADASFWGEDAGDYSGISVAGAGDVNGDGYDDILIGACLDEDGGIQAGQTYLILGNASGWAMDTDLSNADASFWGEDVGDSSGFSVAGAGDVNGDGYDDILIGAHNNGDGTNGAGQTYLVLGKALGWAMDTDLSNADASFWGEDAVDVSGRSVAGAGDVNGDGYDDILIGAYFDEDGGTEAGQTYLVLGKASGWSMDTDLSNADASFWGEDADDQSGMSVAGAGDVNGDGYDDILIGAWLDEDGGSEAGQTYLVLGKALGWSMDTDLSNADASFWGEDADDHSGRSVAGAGDVNGDGYDDILIGADSDDDGGNAAGQTYLVLGKASGWAMDTDLSNVDASFLGEDTVDFSGYSVAGAGDVNGDGYDDILIGANNDEDGGNQAGQTYLIFYESKPTAPTNLDVQLSGDTSSILLSWDPVVYWKNLRGYNLYRSDDGISYRMYDEMDSMTLSYQDTQVEFGKTYRYKVSSTSYPDLESPLSIPVVITNDLDTDMDGIGNQWDDDDDGDSVLDNMDAFPLDPTRWEDPDIGHINNTVIEIQNMITQMLSDLDTMNISLSSVLTNILDNVTGIYDLRIWLETVIDALDTNLTEARVTLSHQLTALNSSLDSFRNNLETDITAISAAVKLHDENTGENHSDILDALDNLLTGGSGTVSLTELKYMLTNLIANLLTHNQTIADDIMGVVGDIDTFEDNTGRELRDINTSLNDLARLEEVLDDLKALNQSVQDGDQELQDSVGVTEILLVLLLVLLVINLLVTLIKRRGNKGSEEAAFLEEPMEMSEIIKETEEEVEEEPVIWEEMEEPAGDKVSNMVRPQPANQRPPSNSKSKLTKRKPPPPPTS